jgi:hypothetical protein
MTSPRRLQLSRKRGSKLPDGAVNCARPTKWGNPFIVGVSGTQLDCAIKHKFLLAGHISLGAQDPAIETLLDHRNFVLANIETLRGRDLACWCKPGTPCHVDTYLLLANEPAAPGGTSTAPAKEPA